VVECRNNTNAASGTRRKGYTRIEDEVAWVRQWLIEGWTGIWVGTWIRTWIRIRIGIRFCIRSSTRIRRLDTALGYGL
jgi:hypothetical protein